MVVIGRFNIFRTGHVHSRTDIYSASLVKILGQSQTENQESESNEPSQKDPQTASDSAHGASMPLWTPESVLSTGQEPDANPDNITPRESLSENQWEKQSETGYQEESSGFTAILDDRVGDEDAAVMYTGKYPSLYSHSTVV